MSRTTNTLLISLICATTGLLSACQTVQDQSIPLAKDFTSKSALVELKRPTWQYKDAHFHQTAAGYEINGADIGFGHLERSELWFKTTGFSGNEIQISDKFLRFIFRELIDFREKTTRQLAFKGERDFAFNTHATNDNSIAPINTRCRLLYLDDVLQIERPRENEKYTRTSIERINSRRYSFLRCELTQGTQTWHLSLDASAKQQPLVKLQLADGALVNSSFQFENVTDSQFLVNGEWRELPLRFKTLSGLKIFDQQVQTGAMSFDGNSPKVWLLADQDKNRSSLLLASSYALMLHDWLDQEWRSPFN